MMLFAFYLNPLIHRLEQQQRKTAVVAYENDVAIFLTEPEEITAIGEALRIYEKATGAMLNISKSQALAVDT
jgi:hypothetical protein